MILYSIIIGTLKQLLICSNLNNIKIYCGAWHFKTQMSHKSVISIPHPSPIFCVYISIYKLTFEKDWCPRCCSSWTAHFDSGTNIYNRREAFRRFSRSTTIATRKKKNTLSVHKTLLTLGTIKSYCNVYRLSKKSRNEIKFIHNSLPREKFNFYLHDN